MRFQAAAVGKMPRGLGRLCRAFSPLPQNHVLTLVRVTLFWSSWDEASSVVGGEAYMPKHKASLSLAHNVERALSDAASKASFAETLRTELLFQDDSSLTSRPPSSTAR